MISREIHNIKNITFKKNGLSINKKLQKFKIN